MKRSASAIDLEEGRVWLRILGVGLVFTCGGSLFLLHLFSLGWVISTILFAVGIVFVLASKK